MSKNIKTLIIVLLISIAAALLTHLKVLPQGGKFSPKYQSFDSLSAPIWFVIIFTSILYGVYLVFERKSREQVNLICPNCETPLTFDKKSEVPKEVKCPKCKTLMVSLEGFYDKK